MKTCSLRHLILISLTLFSMFFGAGNLIFPPFLGQNAGTQAPLALIGFLITAVGFPILGIVAVTRFHGLDKLAAKAHPRLGLLLAILIYLCIGPLLAIPRTATVPFEMAILPLLPQTLPASFALALFSALFFFVCWMLARNPGKLVDRLGKMLTPLLLLLIVIVFAAMLAHPLGSAGPAQPVYAQHPLLQGFLEGYQTMDALAALNFGIVISLIIRALAIRDEQEVSRTSMKAGLLAGAILALVYFMLTWLGMELSSTPVLQNGAQTLSLAVVSLFGNGGLILMVVIFLLACATTCVGLLSSCSEFFSSLTPKISYRTWLLILTVFAFVISNFGLSAILSFSTPILNMIYPMALVLTLLGLCDPLIHDQPLVYPMTVLATGVVSILGELDALGISIPLLSPLIRHLPLASFSLGWITIAIIAFILALFFSRILSRRQTPSRSIREKL